MYGYFYLDDHMLVHNEELRLNCDLCEKEFFSDKTLKLHMKSVHKKHLRYVTFIYIPNDDTLYYPICRLKLVVEKFEHST